MFQNLWFAGLKAVLSLLVSAASMLVAIASSLGVSSTPGPLPPHIASGQIIAQLPGRVGEPKGKEAQDQPEQRPIDRNRPKLMAQLGHGVGNAVVLSRDGKWLFTGGYDGNVGMWDFNSGLEVRAFEGLPGPVRSLALFSDGKRLLVVGETYVKILDVATGRQLPTPWEKTAHIWSAALSADDKRVATAGDGTVRVWELATGKEIRSFKEIGHAFEAILSHDGQLLVTSGDKWVKMWDVASGKELREFRGHQGRVYSLTLSSDGKWLVTTSQDKSARLWNVATGKEIRAFMGHTLDVTCSALSADKKRLVTGGSDRIRLWDVDTGKALSVLSESKQAHTLALTADGKQLVSGNGGARLWDLATGKEIRSFRRQAHDVYFQFLSSDGKSLFNGNNLYNHEINRESGYWDLTGGKYVPSMTPKVDKKTLVDWTDRTDDGKWIITSNKESAHIWDTVTGKKVRSLSWEKQSFLYLTNDAKWLVSVDEKGLLRLWDVDAGSVHRTFKGHTPEGAGDLKMLRFFTKAAISSDKKWLVSEHSECTAKLWDISTGKEVLSVHNDRYLPPRSAISSDSKWLAVSNENIVQLWDLATLKQAGTFQGHPNCIVGLSFSGDGQSLITKGSDSGRIINSWPTDKNVNYRIWQVPSGKTAATFQHPDWKFNSVLSHDGKRVITGSFDYTARVKELPSGKELCKLVSFIDGSWAVFDAEGRYDASNKDGIAGLHWVVEDELFPLRKFRDTYYDPGLLAKYLGFNSEPLKTLPPTP